MTPPPTIDALVRDIKDGWVPNTEDALALVAEIERLRTIVAKFRESAPTVMAEAEAAPELRREGVFS